MKRRKHRLFLSHSSTDKKIVRETAQYLETNGIETIYDDWSFLKGRQLQDEIENAVARSSGFLLFWSALACKSEFVQIELECAHSRRKDDDKYLMQVICLDDTSLPRELSGLIYHDWRRGRPGSKTFEKHLDELERSIRGLPTGESPTAKRAAAKRRAARKRAAEREAAKKDRAQEIAHLLEEQQIVIGQLDQVRKGYSEWQFLRMEFPEEYGYDHPEYLADCFILEKRLKKIRERLEELKFTKEDERSSLVMEARLNRLT